MLFKPPWFCFHGPSKVTQVKEGQSGHALRGGLSRQRTVSGRLLLAWQAPEAAGTCGERKAARCGHVTVYTCVTSPCAPSVYTMFGVSGVSVKLGGRGSRKQGGRKAVLQGSGCGDASSCRCGEDVRFDSIGVGGHVQQGPAQSDLHASSRLAFVWRMELRR